MSLASRLAATVRRPTATVRLGGRLWADVLSLSRDQTYGQAPSSGTVVGRNPPVAIVEGETTISWSWGFDGYEVAGFTGVVTRITRRSYPNQWSLQVADALWPATIQQKDIATTPLNSIPASDAIEQILQGAGISRMSIPDLPASGSAWAGAEWVLGTLTPVSFPNTTALQAAQAICEVLGYWLFADAGGTVRAVLMERRPSGTPFKTLRWGEDFVLSGTPDLERDASQVKNRVEVRGANTGVEGAQIRDEWLTGAGDRTLAYQSPLIEYVNEAQAGAASATAVAKRILTIHARQPNVIRIGRYKADPRIAVGQTIAIQCPPLGYGSPRPFFVYSVSSTMDLRKGDFAQAIVLDGGTGDQGYTTIPPPLAAFSWRLVRESLNGVGVVEVFLDGTGSQSLAGGEIVSWAWSTSTPTQSPFPNTATGPQAMFVYPATTIAAEVTLTVTDTSSKTNTLTQTIDLAGDALTPLNRRTISVALGAAWAVTPDGGQTWNVEATGDSTVVPEVGGETLISTRGAGSTGLRKTADALATASTNLASLGGTITALAQTVGAASRVWAGVGSSLRLSEDGGQTVVTWGTLPTTVVGVLEDPAVLYSVFVLAGNTMWHSTSATAPGSSWAALYVGPAGATARQLVRGQSGATTWISFSGSFTGSPLHRVEGPLTVAFPVDVTPLVSEIRAIALSPDETRLYAWDQAGRIWVIDAQTGLIIAQSTQSHPPGETVQHALHDPDDQIVYVAAFGPAFGPIRKYFPLADQLLSFYDPAAGQQAHRIGYTGAGVAPVAASYPSIRADSIALNLGVGGTPPAGWETIPYDASAWAPATTPVVDTLTLLTAETLAAPGPSDDLEVHLTRQLITLAPGPVERARLRVQVDNAGAWYVNGLFVGEAAPPAGAVEDFTFDVPADVLATGSALVAVRFSNYEAPFSPNPMGTRYVLDVNYEEAP